MEAAQSSPNTPTEGTQKKRRRTEAQLARKRQADRINHKAKREQQKRQMENLETQVTNLQQAVQSLTDQVRVLNERLRDQTRYFSCFDFAETPSPVPAADNSSTSFTLPRPVHSAQDVLLLPADKLPMLVPGPALGEPDNNVPVDCRCGVDHRSYYECLEYSTFSILLRAHQGLNKSISNSTRLPRTPSLVHVFRPTSTDNPVIQILGLVFSQVRPANVRTLFACYVVMYRFLRWRLCPDEETQRDVPQWLYPTEIQKTIPHPVCIDFLPWPGLRDRLIHKSQIQDPRHSVIMYMRSIHFRWPEDQDFIYTCDNGELMPTQNFETGLYTYENWQVSSEWAATFPKLKKYVNDEGSRHSNGDLESSAFGGIHLGGFWQCTYSGYTRSSDDFSTGSARAMGRSELCIMHSLNQDREGSLLKRSSYYGLALSPGSCGIAVNAKSGDSRGGTFVILSYMDVFPR